MLERLLCSDGLTVVTAENGETALRFYREIEPDVVLLDVMMPGMDGFEVCRQLKEDPDTRLTPVVLITGLDAVEDRVVWVLGQHIFHALHASPSCLRMWLRTWEPMFQMGKRWCGL